MSGVVLANASLDIAFHDRLLQCTIFTTSSTTLAKNYSTTSSIKLGSIYGGADLTKEVTIEYNAKYWYIVYWSGLMDAIGDIQVNLNKKKNTLEYRFVIKLPDLALNAQMLDKFTWAIGEGRRTKSAGYLTWELNLKSDLTLEIINSVKFYTTSMICKMKFLNDSKAYGIHFYLSNINNKYKNREAIRDEYSSRRLSLRHKKKFPIWLSGYMEGQAYWSYKKLSKSSCFVIKQKYDKYLIEEIQRFFTVTSPVRSTKRDTNVYIFECYNKKILSLIIRHVIINPIIGAKVVEFSEFAYKVTSR